MWHTFFISSIEIRRCFLTPFDVLSECRLMYRQCARQLCTTYNFFFKVCRSRIPTTNLSWEVWPFSTSVIFRAAELLCGLVDHQSTHTEPHTSQFHGLCWMKNSNELLKKFWHMKTQNSFFSRFSFWSTSDLLQLLKPIWSN